MRLLDRIRKSSIAAVASEVEVRTVPINPLTSSDNPEGLKIYRSDFYFFIGDAVEEAEEMEVVETTV